MFGKMYDMKQAYWAAGLFFVGFLMTYMPLFLAGGAGMPRRYADYLPKYTHYHQFSTVGSWILAASLLLMITNLVRSLFNGQDVTDENPWGGATLEWRTATPPPTLNFDGEPDMSRGTYEYPTEVTDD
jgi:cytochrome c oxidase subunit 1